MKFFSKIKSLGVKKIILIIVVLLIIIGIIISAIIYNNNDNARVWMDKNIFRKEKIQDNLPSIEVENMDSSKVCVFNKHIGVLKENKFQIYDNTAKKENELTIDVAKPIFSTSGRYLVIAEQEGQKVYLIEDKNILWERNVEGNIAQITINQNGYVAVTIVDTLYKSVIAVYNNQGELLFKTLFSTTRASTASISNDNKYLAVGEIDTSGAKVVSNIKIYSVNEAKKNPEEAIKSTYTGESGDLIIKLKFQSKNKLLCMYSDKIVEIKTDETKDEIQKFNDKKISFTSIDLSDASVTIEEKSSGIFTVDSIINIMNSDNKNISTYKVDSVIKEIYTSDNVIALNLGAEVEFVNTNGWLLKKYSAKQEINNVALSDSLAGIIYRDNIEIINL